MKKVFCIAVICCSSHYLFAQDSSMMNDKTGKAQDTMMMKDTGSMHETTMGMMSHEEKMEDCVYMHDGKMMVMKAGSEMVMKDNMTMTDGTMVMKDGTVKMKNGSSKKLTNGECVYISGKMSRMRMDGM